MNLNDLPKDVLVELAVDMPILDVIRLCGIDKKRNRELCENNVFWRKKLDKDYPGWKILNEIESRNLYIDLFDAQKVEGREDLYDKYYFVKLNRLYPDTDWNDIKKNLQERERFYMSNKAFYEKVMSTINGLKTKYNYSYIDGNPFFQHNYLREYIRGNPRHYQTLLQEVIFRLPSFGIVKYAYDNGGSLSDAMIKEFLESRTLKGFPSAPLPYSKNLNTWIKLKKFLEGKREN